MLVEQYDINKKYPFILMLMSARGVELAEIKDAFNRHLEIKSEDISTLSFDIPYNVEDTETHLFVKNDYYELLQVGMIIRLNNDRKFVIVDAWDNEGESDIKNITALSLENQYTTRRITLDSLTRELYSDTEGSPEGILNIIEKNFPLFKVGYVDPACRYETINGGSVKKYRFFDVFRKPLYEFIRTDLQQAFNIIVYYDTINRVFNVYDRDTFGEDTGIYISKENYAKYVKRQIVGDNIVTRLSVSGNKVTPNGTENIFISGVNLLGGDYVENFDFYKINGQMDEILINALDRYDLLLAEKNIEYQNLKTILTGYNATLVTRQAELTQLEEELDALIYTQMGYAQAGNNTQLPTATANVNNKKSQISTKNAQITSVQSQINGVLNQIEDIAEAIQRQNARDIDTNELIFTEDDLIELENFIHEEDWSSDYFDNEQSLYNGAIEKLADWSEPPIEFDISLVDLLSCAELQDDWENILTIGNYITVHMSNLNLDYNMKIVSYSYEPDSNNFSMTFSNKNKKIDNIRDSNAINNNAVESGKSVNRKKLEWNQVVGLKTGFDDYKNNALDMAKQNVIASQGRNKVDISENGEFITDTENPNLQLILTAGQLLITDDALETVRTAVNSQGITAEELIGEMILSNKLFVKDTTGTFSIVNNLLTIKDASNNIKVKIGMYAPGQYGVQVFSSTGQSLINGDSIVSDELRGEIIYVDGALRLKRPTYQLGVGAARIEFLNSNGDVLTLQNDGLTGIRFDGGGAFTANNFYANYNVTCTNLIATNINTALSNIYARLSALEAGTP
jgi:hypothetical protein